MSNKQRKNSNTQAAKPALLDPTPAKASGIAFTLASVLPVGVSMIVLIIIQLAGLETHIAVSETEKISKDWYRYVGFLISPVAFAIVAAAYFAWLKKPIKETAKKQACHWKYYVIAIVMQIGLFSLSLLNSKFVEFLERFGYKNTDIDLPNMDGARVIAVIFCVAVLPAIFEELIFRGILLDGLRSFGEVGAILICGGLFAIYHQNPIQTIYQFCCGAAFAWIALRAGSILPTVLSHFVNNAAIILLTKYGLDTFSPTVFWIVFGVSMLCLLGSLAYLIFFDRKKGEVRPNLKKNKAEMLRFAVCALAGVVICVVTWITTLVTGF